MSPAHVLEPTYQNLKRGLMEGNWRPGERLEALRLADEFGVSMTPVRDCLNRLAGEGLVDMHPGDGYRVARISEKLLRDMIDLCELLLGFAICHPAKASLAPESEFLGEDYANSVAALFKIIASRSGNIVLSETVHSLGDRLHAIRRWEPQLFPDCLSELEAFKSLLAGDAESLRLGLSKYHDRRRNGVEELIQLAQS